MTETRKNGWWEDWQQHRTQEHHRKELHGMFAGLNPEESPLWRQDLVNSMARKLSGEEIGFLITLIKKRTQ
jgi:hypothetical protein